MPGLAPVPINPGDFLRQWLAESDMRQAGELLEALTVHAKGTIRRIVEFKLSGRCKGRGASSADIEDNCSEALTNLLSKLVRIKASGDNVHIQNFDDYTATVAFNACFEYIRKKYPKRRGLSDQLRYLLKHKPEFRLWRTAEGIELCGHEAWQRRGPVPTNGSLRHALEAWPSRRPSVDLLLTIFQATGGPVEFETLVDEIADVWEIRSQLSDPPDDDNPTPVRSQAAINSVCDREFLQWLWTAICRLPLDQKRALLLNIKDSYGGDIAVFGWSGVATVGQIGEAVEIPASEFAEIWRELPISDKRIADRFGLSIQAVINRRSSARKTLRKQLKDTDYGNQAAR